MKYDLAKYLSDAGLTPKSHAVARIYHSTATNRESALPEREVSVRIFDDLTFGASHFICIPTLEDLIEACGRGFRTLDRDSSGGSVKWLRNTYPDEDDERAGDIIGGGSAEAVTTPWLKLREND